MSSLRVNWAKYCPYTASITNDPSRMDCINVGRYQ